MQFRRRRRRSVRGIVNVFPRGFPGGAYRWDVRIKCPKCVNVWNFDELCPEELCHHCGVVVKTYIDDVTAAWQDHTQWVSGKMLWWALIGSNHVAQSYDDFLCAAYYKERRDESH